MKVKKVKKCPKCGRKLPASAFYRDITQVDDLSIHCKKCVTKYFQQYMPRNE